MIRIASLCFVFALCATAASPGAAESPRNHEWLGQLVGEWDIRFKIHMQPDQPPVESSGTDTVRALGDHWITAETKTTMMGAPFSGILSLGYNEPEARFHATWIDSLSGYLWVYKGSLNDAGDTLTLETEGPSPIDPDDTLRYREVIRITGEDTRTFTSSMETGEGEWTRILSIDYQRRPGGAAPQQGERAPEAGGTIDVHYLEIVTPEVAATCIALGRAHGVEFSEPIAELGGARTATLGDGGRIAVRAPLRETEAPVVRPYLLVDDIEAALRAAEKAGAQVALPPTNIPGQGTFAIYVLGGIDHGLWKL